LRDIEFSEFFTVSGSVVLEDESVEEAGREVKALEVKMGEVGEKGKINQVAFISMRLGRCC